MQYMLLFFIILLLTYQAIGPDIIISKQQLSSKPVSSYSLPSDMKVANEPSELAINPNTNILYVGHDDGYGFTAINLTTNEIIKRLENIYVFGLAVNPNTNRIYLSVANSEDGENGRFVVMDGTTNKIIKNNTMGNYPTGIAINPSRNKIYVQDGNNDTVYVLDERKNQAIVSKFKVANYRTSIHAVNNSTGKLYATAQESNAIYIIDDSGLKPIINNISVGMKPNDISVNPFTNMIYVTFGDSNRLAVINGSTNKVTRTIIYENYFGVRSPIPARVSINPVTDHIYISNPDADHIVVINGSSNSVMSTVKTGADPSEMVINSKTQKMYVANFKSSIISLIDVSEEKSYNVINNTDNETGIDIPGIKITNHPTSIAINTKTNIIYASDLDGILYVIDDLTDQIIAKIKFKDFPTHSFLLVNPNTNKIYTFITDEEHPSVYVIDANKNYGISNITLNEPIYSAAIDPILNKVYVAHYDSISVINGQDDRTITPIKGGFHGLEAISLNPNNNNIHLFGYGKLYTITELGKILENSTVPLYAGDNRMDINPNTDLLYISNNFENTIHVVDPYGGRIIKNISLGSGSPITYKSMKWEKYDLSHNRRISVEVDPNNNDLYATNIITGNITIIDGLKQEVVKSTQVGSPVGLAISPNSHQQKIYIANWLPDTISVINASTNRIVTGNIFKVNPLHAGHIRCNNEETPTDQYILLEPFITCAAEANNGFQFSSWSENFGHNSSKTLSTSSNKHSSFFEPLLNIFGYPSFDNSTLLRVSKFGNFTANFERVPPPIPPEYWIPLYGIVVSSIVGWSIPSIIGWTKSKKQGRTVHEYHKRSSSLYRIICDDKLDCNYIELLDKLKNDITDAYTKGKISEQHYNNLKNEISILYEEIFKKRIDSLYVTALGKDNNAELLKKIKDDVSDAYAKGKISEQHYNLLNEKISDYKSKQEPISKLPSSLQNITPTSKGERCPIKVNK